MHNYLWLTLRAASTQSICAPANCLLIHARWLRHYLFLHPPQQTWRNQLLAYGSISTLLGVLMRVEWDSGSVICDHVSEAIHSFEWGWLEVGSGSMGLKLSLEKNFSLHVTTLGEYECFLNLLNMDEDPRFRNPGLFVLILTLMLLSWAKVSAHCFQTGCRPGAEGFLQAQQLHLWPHYRFVSNGLSD